MERSGLQRVIPIVLILIVVAASIAALISLGQEIFGGGNTNEKVVNRGKEVITKTDDTRGVRMTVRGEIVGDGEFNSYSLTIRPFSRTMTTYVGYNKKPLQTKHLSNNKEAYEEFVYALDYAGFMDDVPFKGEADDTRGICATGNLVVFEVLNGASVVQRLWATDCRGIKGSFKGSPAYVKRLFREQVPEYNDLIRKLNL